jgi:hypothetical protein
MWLSLLGAVDANLQGVITQLTTYFADNIVVVIGAFVTIAMALWMLSILFRSTGVKKPTRVG